MRHLALILISILLLVPPTTASVEGTIIAKDGWGCPWEGCPAPYYQHHNCKCFECRDYPAPIIIWKCKPFNELAHRCTVCGYTEFWWETVGRLADAPTNDTVTTDLPSAFDAYLMNKYKKKR